MNIFSLVPDRRMERGPIYCRQFVDLFFAIFFDFVEWTLCMATNSRYDTLTALTTANSETQVPTTFAPSSGWELHVCRDLKQQWGCTFIIERTGYSICFFFFRFSLSLLIYAYFPEKSSYEKRNVVVLVLNIVK